MQAVYDFLNWIDGNILWGIPMIILILGCGVFLTIRAKFFQVRKFGLSFQRTFGDSFRQMKKKEKNNDKSNISPFEAFATAVSGTIGTGNIVGVTTAIVSGGPGAVFWMWISAFFGSMTKFSEIVLGVFYRKKDDNNEFIGGPMYYIEQGTGKKWLAVLFAVFAIFASIGIGSVQADTIQKTWFSLTDGKLATWITAIIVVFFAALVLIGGIKRIGKVASILVPFMAVFFILLSIVILIINISAIPVAFASIFTSAFSTKSLIGGFAGYGISIAMRFGFARGVFCNEAGLGSSPIAHCTTTNKEPVEQALWGVFEVFLVNFIICTMTALCVLTSGQIVSNASDGAVVAMTTFSGKFGLVGEIMYSIILPLFAFSTVLAWAVYGSKATQFLFNKHQKGANLGFNIVYLVIILALGFVTSFAGDNIGSDFIWLISDMTNALMAIPNLIGLFILSKQVLKITKNYFDRKNGLPVEPMISAYSDLEN
ncbi:MAG: sodium:alanine symporter family protein [Clostridia bacterium]|nr:sodium:alanine symporter family protein [Clostridia bacterium]